MRRVFLSFAPEDRAAAQLVEKRLTTAGARVFSDESSIVAGGDWTKQLEDSLAESDSVVVLLSNSSRRSSWVASEVQAALERKRAVLPVLLDSEARDNWLWPLLAERQGIEMKLGSPDLGRQLDAITERLRLDDPSPSASPTRNYVVAILVLSVLILSTAVMYWSQWPMAQPHEMDRKIEAELQRVRAEEADRLKRQVDAERALAEGVRLVEQGKLSEAISQYEESIRLNPESAVAHEYLGYARLRRAQIDRDARPDDVQKAIEALERAASLDQKYVWAPYNLSLAYWQAGRKNDAIAQIRRVLEIDPNFVSIISKDRQFMKFRQSRDFREMIPR